MYVYIYNVLTGARREEKKITFNSEQTCGGVRVAPGTYKQRDGQQPFGRIFGECLWRAGSLL